jgi:hypothetical protein
LKPAIASRGDEFSAMAPRTRGWDRLRPPCLPCDQSQNVARVVVPAINDMIDITTVRTAASYTRIPAAILTLLLVVALCSAATAGYAMAKRGHRSFLHIVLYATSIAMTLYVVLGLEHPRLGLIRLDATDRILEALRESIQ